MDPRALQGLCQGHGLLSPVTCTKLFMPVKFDFGKFRSPDALFTVCVSGGACGGGAGERHACTRQFEQAF